ncbi:TetR/AcrR family transcriptional regulator [Nocardia bovistercoris]|uniref:TetR/AcrR family transcriptional regulator n=1 Tax=Nocardia bovistercoris TaxID=2785916 RepID=A0A931N6D7_9NOCA|nr:TetR/AcrR family transcriptional regulator [Nocardia bovistercoris]MBH0779588.1 TetR/AcrR family transcriptional regulator [Nocardia bovistercoris]
MAREANVDGAQRIPLTRQRLVAAAVAVADEQGVHSLTMRKVADRLGVEAMSLYHHVGGKPEILDGMVDAVFAEVELPDPEGGWLAATRSRAVSLRAALLRHPWAVGLMESRADPGPATLRHHDWAIGVLSGAGFSLIMIAHTLSVVDSYVYGFVLQEVNLPFDGEGELGEMAADIKAAMPPDAYPHLNAFITGHALRPGYAYADEFTFGLDLILDGLVARAAAEAADRN